MVQITENTIILVDGSSYLYRAYNAFPSLINSLGEPTGAIYGVLNMLKSLLMQHCPTHVAVVFDTKGKTFRDELFKHYKSHRPPMPKDLCSQIAPLHYMINAMGLSLLAVNGVEADDVIGTLACAAARDGRNVVISTSDKDMAQLVSSKIALINTMSNSILGPEEVKLKFGVPPELIIDYLALIGDSSDNIPGVPGIGKQTARVLLQELGGLKNIYQQLHNVSALSFRGAKTITTKLELYREVAFLSYQLATIKTDVALDLFYDQLTVKEPEIKALMLLFQRYEFKRWLNDLKTGRWLLKCKNTITPLPLFTAFHQIPAEKSIIPLLEDGYVIINNMSILNVWINLISRSSIFVFDIKADMRDQLITNLVGFCFAINPGEVAYLPLGHDYLDTPNQLNYMVVLAALKPVFENPTIGKISQNLKFNYGVLRQYNIELAGVTFDVMLESYVLNSISGCHDLSSLAKRFLQYTTIKFEDIAGKGCNQLALNKITIEKVASYASSCINLILCLHHKLWPCIKRTPELRRVFEEIEIPLAPILSRIERTGVLIDKTTLSIYSCELTKRLEKLEVEVHQLAEESFNLSSTKQLQAILYNKHKLPVIKKTLGGAPSTNEEVLTKLALMNYSLPKLILEYRGLAKLKFTYVNKLLQMINQLSKRVHTSYHQTITSTGRLSSSNPNLQNIPARNNNDCQRIRQAFIAPPNALIVTADYSHIELRIMAHFTHDSKLMNAFAFDLDVHRATAAEIFNIPLEEVTQEQRRCAKVINFGLIYGMSAFGLARQLSISQLEAQKYINLYFERHPSIFAYMESTRLQAKDLGYVKTICGRRLYLPDINSRNDARKKSAERAAINAPIQGTAADIIKLAMIAIDGWLQKEVIPVRMVMQVHDELVFEVQRDIVDIAKTRIKSLMEGCFKLDVPLKVDLGVGKNWGKLSSLGNK